MIQMVKCHKFHPMMKMALLVVVHLLTLAAVCLQVVLVTRAPLITQITVFVGKIGARLFVNNGTNPREVTTIVRKQKDGSSKSYPCPQSVDLYKYMGGIDMADAMRRVHSCSRKSKHKWYVRLFSFLADTSVVNVYIIEGKSPNHQLSGSRRKVHQSQLDFVLELGQQLVESHSSRITLLTQEFG